MVHILTHTLLNILAKPIYACNNNPTSVRLMKSRRRFVRVVFALRRLRAFVLRTVAEWELH